MNQDRQYIILAVHDTHVILKPCCSHRNTLSRKHPDDVILQAIEVHLDVGLHGVIGSRGGPVAFADSTL